MESEYSRRLRWWMGTLMPVPTHFKFTVRGHFGTTDEGWSFGWHMNRDVSGGTDAELDDIDESAVTTAVTSYIGSVYVGDKVVIDDWRAYVIGTDGTMEGSAPLQHIFTGTLPKGGNASATYPPQVALKITTVALERGPAQFGGWYLPIPSQGIGTDCRLSAATALTYATQASTFLKNVSNAIDMPGVTTSSAAVNVSKGPPGSTTGTRQEVDHVEVGRVLDTIRSRRNKLLEERQADAHIDW